MHWPPRINFLLQGIPTTTTVAIANILQWTLKAEPDLKDLVPKEYHNSLDVFKKPKPLVLPP